MSVRCQSLSPIPTPYLVSSLSLPAHLSNPASPPLTPPHPSGSGIGLACAHRFAEAGAAGVAFADIDTGAALRAANASGAIATNKAYRVLVIHVDVTSETEVEDMVKRAQGEFGRIDYAVNCAGVCIFV